MNRFPEDFMFQLTNEEFKNLKSQFVISKVSDNQTNMGGNRKSPNVFTSRGLSMLSGVLNSEIAIQTHIQIIRVFDTFMQYASEIKEESKMSDVIEFLLKKDKYNELRFESLFDTLNELVDKPKETIKKIGFELKGKE